MRWTLEKLRTANAIGRLTGNTDVPNLTINSDPYLNSRSMVYRFRQKRYQQARVLIDEIVSKYGRCRILDIGGTEWYWSIASTHINDPRILVDLVNLERQNTTKPNFRSFVGNACDLGGLDDMSYDFVHSNSVIEHVGIWDNMMRFASNVRRLAPVYFVQTPYYWFPIEPHFRVPMFHWLPESLRYRTHLGPLVRLYEESQFCDRRRAACPKRGPP